MPRCKECKEKFEVKYFNQKFCMGKDDCITAFVQAQKELNDKQKEKAWKARKKVLKEKSKTLGEHKKDLERIINSCIREIDKGYSCISCEHDKPSNAGHYRSVGSNPQLRFNPFNIFNQCINCNLHNGGRPIEYREGMIERYGKECADEILEGAEPFHNLRIHEIEEMKKIAREFLKYAKSKEGKNTISETIEMRALLMDELRQVVEGVKENEK